VVVSEDDGFGDSKIARMCACRREKIELTDHTFAGKAASESMGRFSFPAVNKGKVTNQRPCR
jgi:hypothetical protein